MSRPRGVTLIELLVVLALLGIMAGVVGLAWRPERWQFSNDTANPYSWLRRRAAETGRAVSDTVTIDGRVISVMALPDGRVVGSSRLRVNPLTGEVTDAHR
jgi:prepilin-type N-terminal cleavage/methylation domain-containing protein